MSNNHQAQPDAQTAPTPLTFPAPTFKPPYYAAIFTAINRADDATAEQDYGTTLGRMLELARARPGFLGLENATSPSANDGSDAPAMHGRQSITISYWADEEAIKGWKRDLEHLGAQKRGRNEWYQEYQIRVAKVERAYGFKSKA